MSSLQAEARIRGKRQGFNFGTNIRMMTDNDQFLPTGNDNKSSKIHRSSHAVSPFVGYAFKEFLNLGVNVYYENSEVEEKGHDNPMTMEKFYQNSTSVKGAGVFGRFLFARVMFFEAGLGIYDQKVTSRIETRSIKGKNFEGSVQSDEARGMGPGYHLGGGLELPITEGFYFTTSYLMRMYHLRDYKPQAQDLGAKRAREQRRELTFGIMHYYD
jgi:hypothetical protein